VIAYRIYVDSVFEQLPMFEKATEPPRYILYTPALFDAWCEWYSTLPQSQHGNDMTPLGAANAPEWVIFEFSTYEEFFQHYMHITQEV